ncbi:MAG: serine O-acetyltransferase EpsC [bacterium]
MPSIEELDEVIQLLRTIFFPGYFGKNDSKSSLKLVEKKLKEQILRGFCFFCKEKKESCSNCEERSKAIAYNFIKTIPNIKELLSTDAIAAYEGDPAASSVSETIFCYPSLRALSMHRVAHELNKLGVPLIPRIISENAHSTTGIDIHPGAQIGEKFFMDHGTGIVIGETTIIGKNVRLYQGVTLGAKSFPLDEKGRPIKGMPRHPIVEENVIIYSGATILGRITIGKNSTIGGNVWLTDAVPEDSWVTQGTNGHVEIKRKTI